MWWLAVLLLANESEDAIEHIKIKGQATERVAEVMPVQVISRNEIARLQGGSITPLLRQIAGADVMTTGLFGGQTSIMMQGGASSHVLVLIDGQPITSPTLGTASLQNLHPDDIERIEITRGARASTYGGNSMAGVIHIYTRQAQENTASIRIRHGAYNFREAAFTASHRTERFNQQLNLVRRWYEGYDLTTDTEFGNQGLDGAHATNLTWNAKWQVNDNNQFSARLFDISSRAEYDQDCLDPDSFERVYCLPAVRVKQQGLQTQLQQKLQSGVTQTFQFGHFEERSTTTDGAELPQTWLGFNDVLDTERQTFNWQRRVPLAGGNQAISYGVDWDREQASMQPESYGSKSRQTNSVFSDYFWRYPKWQLSAGGRLAHNSQYGSKLTHSVDLSLTPIELWKFGVSHSSGYRPPTFNDLYWPGSGNPDLRPESSNTLSAYARHYIRAGMLEASLFYSDFSNLIVWHSPTEGGLWQPANIGGATAQGLTLRWEHNWRQWRVRAHATVQDTEDKATGTRLLNRAHSFGTITVSQGFADGVMSLDFVAHGSRRVSMLDNGREASTWTLNGRWEQAFSREWMFYLSLDNIFDNEYEFRPGYNEPRRQFRIGISYHFRTKEGMIQP